MSYKFDFEQMIKYQKEHFEVAVELDRYREGTIVMSVTDNGRQWMSISFPSPEEVQKTIKALQEFLAAHPRSDGGRDAERKTIDIRHKKG